MIARQQFMAAARDSARRALQTAVSRMHTGRPIDVPPVPAATGLAAGGTLVPFWWAMAGLAAAIAAVAGGLVAFGA